MNFDFTQKESDDIIAHFGVEFFERLKKDIVFYSDRWGLGQLRLVDYFSVNCIFLCYSKHFGDTVLKIGRYGIFNEYNTLLEYNGEKFCRAFDCDLENNVILIEQIKPAIQLRAEKNMQKRLSAFCSIYKELHIEPTNPRLYPTYTDWVCNAAEFMSKQDTYKELNLYIQKAKEICIDINKEYDRQMLLHGDLHHDNILLGQSGYRIIDPKGVVGDPIFDIPRFILNEYDDDTLAGSSMQNILQVINFFEKSLNVPSDIIKKCFFIETAMAQCWRVQRNKIPNIENVRFAEKLLDI